MGSWIKSQKIGLQQVPGRSQDRELPGQELLPLCVPPGVTQPRSFLLWPCSSGPSKCLQGIISIKSKVLKVKLSTWIFRFQTRVGDGGMFCSSWVWEQWNGSISFHKNGKLGLGVASVHTSFKVPLMGTLCSSLQFQLFHWFLGVPCENLVCLWIR